MDRGAWRAAVHGVAESQIRLRQLSTRALWRLREMTGNYPYIQALKMRRRLYCIGLPKGQSGKESACPCRSSRRCGFDPWVGKILWRRKWQPTPVFLPGKCHGQRSLARYSPRGPRVGCDLACASTYAHTVL